ncbi:MAG: hypothetical protein ABIA93_04920 [Candidatus Woesearchaeota archaeon]
MATVSIPIEDYEEFIQMKSNLAQSISRQSCRVSHSEAKARITLMVKAWKAENRSSIDVLDIHFETRLPFDQINKVLAELAREGLIHESSKTD